MRILYQREIVIEYSTPIYLHVYYIYNGFKMASETAEFLYSVVRLVEKRNVN